MERRKLEVPALTGKTSTRPAERIPPVAPLPRPVCQHNRSIIVELVLEMVSGAIITNSGATSSLVKDVDPIRELLGTHLVEHEEYREAHSCALSTRCLLLFDFVSYLFHQ